MAEIWSVAISAGVALIVGLLAHGRAMRVQRSEKRIRKETATNEQMRTIIDGYEGLVNTLHEEAQRVAVQLASERLVWEAREKRLLEEIDKLREELKTERQERIQLQARLGRLEKRMTNLRIE